MQKCHSNFTQFESNIISDDYLEQIKGGDDANGIIIEDEIVD